MRKRTFVCRPPFMTSSIINNRMRKEWNKLYEYDNLGGEISFTP